MLPTFSTLTVGPSGGMSEQRLLEIVLDRRRLRFRRRLGHVRLPLDLLRGTDPVRIAVQADLAGVDRDEAELESRGIGLQAEVKMGRVHELGIGDQRVPVVTARLPLGQGRLPELDVAVGVRGVPVQVSVHDELVVRPAAFEQLAVVEVDDVPLEGERDVLFLARAAELVVLAERPDVVADDVLLAVMLVEVGVGRAVADVVLDQDAGAALVGIDRQRPRVVVVDVVHQIVAQHRPRRISQAVDAAHVAEHAPADVVDVVELDHVVMRAGRGIPPTPADRDAGVVQVADLVVRDPVVAGPADPDAHRAGIDLAAVVDQVVVDGIALGGLGLGLAGRSARRDARRRPPGRESRLRAIRLSWQPNRSQTP